MGGALGSSGQGPSGRGSSTYYVAAEGGEGVWDLQLLQRRGEGGSWGLQRCTFDKAGF